MTDLATLESADIVVVATAGHSAIEPTIAALRAGKIVALANKDVYLERYAQPDKGHTDRSDAWWPAPYWDIDTGFATLLMHLTAVNEDLGSCFIGLPAARVGAFKEAFGVPAEFSPIGALTIGYRGADKRSPSLRRGHRPVADVVHHGRWTSAGEV
jgi:nitroreductase